MLFFMNQPLQCEGINGDAIVSKGSEFESIYVFEGDAKICHLFFQIG
jgi:hypothetical protein